MNFIKCPFGCSHHVFPDHFNFCPFCGSKLIIEENTPKSKVKVKNSVYPLKRGAASLFPEF